MVGKQGLVKKRELQGADKCWVLTHQLFCWPPQGQGGCLTMLNHAVFDGVVPASSGVTDVGE